MRHTHRTLSFAVFAAALLAAGGARAVSPPLGVWIDDTGEGGIEITECAGKLCGHFVWFKKSENAENCGKQILGEAAPAGDGAWDNGWIYSPEKKRRFDLELKPLSNDKLQVMGYAGLKILNKTMIWSRAPADLARCDGGSQAASAGAGADAPRSPPGSEPARSSAAPQDAGAAPAGSPRETSGLAARAEAAPPAEEPDPRPAGGRNGEDREDQGAAPPARGRKGNSNRQVPYVTLTFPCKD